MEIDMRRAYLKKTVGAMTHVKSGVDAHRIKEITSHRPLNWKDIAFLRMFGLGGTAADDRTARAMAHIAPRFSKDPTPRDAVLLRLQKATENIEPYNHIRLIPKTLYMFWNRHYYFLLKYDCNTGNFVSSIKYPERARLMFAYEHNFVHWETDQTKRPPSDV